MSSEMIEYVKFPTTCVHRWKLEVYPSASNRQELDEWSVKDTIDWYGSEVSPSIVKELDVAQEFAALASEWKEATWALASIKRRIAHSAYLRIIGMGPVAIPLLLKELRREPDYWHYALEAITRQNPAPNDADMKAVIEAWLAWGERRGYCHP